MCRAHAVPKHFRYPPNSPRWGAPLSHPGWPERNCEVPCPRSQARRGWGWVGPAEPLLRSFGNPPQARERRHYPAQTVLGLRGLVGPRPFLRAAGSPRFWRPRARIPIPPGLGGAVAPSAEPHWPAQARSRPWPPQGLRTCFLFQLFLASGWPRGTGTAASVYVCMVSRPLWGGPGRAGSTDLSCLAGAAVGAGTVRGWCPCRGAAAAVVLRQPCPPSLVGGSELPVTVSGQNRARMGTAQSCCMGIGPGGQEDL